MSEKATTVRTNKTSASTMNLENVIKLAGDVGAARALEETAKQRNPPSPSTMAALREDAPARVSLRQHIEHAEAVKRARSGRAGGEDLRSEIMSRGAYADLLRTRATVTNATGAVVPAWYRDTADSPEQGGRLAGLFRVRDATDAAIGISEETGSRAAVVVPKDYGSALPESAATYSKTELASSRFGAFLPAWKSILDDSQALADALYFVLDRDIARQIDAELLSGDGTGTAYGAHFTGLADSSLTTQSATGTNRWLAILTAAGTIRAADWTGPITTILHPTDAVSLFSELASATTKQPVFADALAGLSALGADRFVISSLATQGTGYTGSWSEYGTLYVREPPTIAISDSDADDFVTGKVKIKVEGRLTFRKHHGTAAVQLTNL